MQGLASALAADPALAQAYEVLVWDNSPEPLPDPQVNAHLNVPFTYRHSQENAGVAGAYNGAMEFALTRGQPWMLLLDQDSAVSAPFLALLRARAAELEPRSEIAAIAPRIEVGSIVMSPKRFLFNRTRPYPNGTSGVLTGEPTVINSGCLLRTGALREAGGFGANFWLDYADIDLFHRLYLRGKRVWYAPEAEMQHEMSVMDYDRLMAPWRYRNLLIAESAFFDQYKGWLEGWGHNLKLLRRIAAQQIKYKNKQFSRDSWAGLRYRLTVSRQQRLADWKAGAGRVIPWAAALSR